MAAFGDAEEIICITITGALSGSYNAATQAAKKYESENPGRKVFVLDSLSTGPEMALIIEKIRDLSLQNKNFSDICEEIKNYSKETGLLFMLESMRNLANNGRVNPIVAKMAGILGIRVVGKASDKGELEPLKKCRGENKALENMIDNMKALGVKGGKIKIAHCFNEKAANCLKKLVEHNFENTEIDIYSCGGLCSFYAEKGGVLIGFVKG